MWAVSSLAVILLGGAVVKVEVIARAVGVAAFPFFLGQSRLRCPAFLHWKHKPFFISHCLVDLSDDVDVHSAVIFLLSEVPSGFQFFLLWYVSPKDPLYLMLIVVRFKGFFVPFGKGLGHVIPV